MFLREEAKKVKELRKKRKMFMCISFVHGWLIDYGEEGLLLEGAHWGWRVYFEEKSGVTTVMGESKA